MRLSKNKYALEGLPESCRLVKDNEMSIAEYLL